MFFYSFFANFVVWVVLCLICFIKHSFNPSNVTHVDFCSSVQISVFRQQTQPFQNLQVVPISIIHKLNTAFKLPFRINLALPFCSSYGSAPNIFLVVSGDHVLLCGELLSSGVLGDLHGGSWLMTWCHSPLKPLCPFPLGYLCFNDFHLWQTCLAAFSLPLRFSALAQVDLLQKNKKIKKIMTPSWQATSSTTSAQCPLFPANSIPSSFLFTLSTSLNQVIHRPSRWRAAYLLQFEIASWTWVYCWTCQDVNKC